MIAPSRTCTEVARYFRTQADWRRAKIAEYPHDADRNLQSADALDSLADYIESGDAATIELEPHMFADGDILGGQRVMAETRRYGFGYAVKSHRQHDELLGSLWPLALADAYDFAAKAGEDPTDSLYPCELAPALAGFDLPDLYWSHRANSTESEAEDRLSAYLIDEVAA